MGRGKHQLTKDKRDIKSLTKIAAATARAEKELDKKIDIPLWLKARLEKIIDKVDFLELVALIGITVLVKGAIDKSEDIRSKIHPFITFGEIPEGYKAVFSGIPFWYDLVKEGDKYEGMLPDFMDWIVSFGVAFVIVRHGGAILGAGGSLLNTITNLFS